MRRLLSAIRAGLLHPTGNVVAAALLCGAFTSVSANFRVAGPLVFVPLAGAAVLVLIGVLLAFRLGRMLVARLSPATLQHAAQLALLVVMNFVVLTVVLGLVGALVGTRGPTNVDRMLALLMAATLHAGAWSGVACTVTAVTLLVVMGGSRLVDRVPALAALERGLTRTVWALLTVYTLYAPLLVVSVARRWLGPAPTTVATVVTAVEAPFGARGATWLEVESWWRPGTVERIPLLYPADEAAVWRMQPGRRVRLDTGPGPFGVPWVDRLRVDVDHRLPELVAAVPTAQWPRRQLITELARTARWSELVEHARAYHHHHPADRAAIADVVLSLRKGGQLETALALESELGLGPPPRGVTS